MENRTEFRLKFGAAKIEFIGDAEFLKAEIMPAVSKIFAVAEAKPPMPSLNQIDHIAPKSDTPANVETLPNNLGGNVGSLASHIKAHDADQNQLKRFLVTAYWLRLRGKTTIKTDEVVTALRDNQQAKLGNASDCLNKNVGKGFCEKTAEGFFIAPEGLEYLGKK
ncbi:MAG: hypothetical protein M3O03_10865 [Pseudomonadota bacterium]|nr:hypothetical protein [Pseudomonadota bacterium]